MREPFVWLGDAVTLCEADIASESDVDCEADRERSAPDTDTVPENEPVIDLVEVRSFVGAEIVLDGDSDAVPDGVTLPSVDLLVDDVSVEEGDWDSEEDVDKENDSLVDAERD